MQRAMKKAKKVLNKGKTCCKQKKTRQNLSSFFALKLKMFGIRTFSKEKALYIGIRKCYDIFKLKILGGYKSEKNI